MFTINSRIKIGFPRNKIDWTKARAIFDNHTLRIAGHPVMEDWEKGYMKSLARIASINGGRVLEVGYGLGLSASAIQRNGIKDHYIIECHPEVVSKSVKDLQKPIKKNTVHIMSGFWEDITPILANKSFDGILFDTYPLSEQEIHGNHFWFFKEAYRLLKPGGVLTYYSDEAHNFSPNHLAKLIKAGFKKEDIKYEICKVNPPKNCEYWQDKTIIAPIIKKAKY